MFSAGTVISPDQVNTDFSTVYANALNRFGGIMAGNLTWSADATFDVGASGASRMRDLFVGRNEAVAGTLGVTGATTLSSTLGVTGAATFSAATPAVTLSGSAPQLSLANGTANAIQWTTIGVASPTFTTRSNGTKIILYPNVTATTVDIGFGVESGALWQAVELDTDRFYWYHGQTRTMALAYEGGSYTLPSLNLFPSTDTIGAHIQISNSTTGAAPAVLQSGEPGVTVSAVIVGVNYHAISTAASARINTAIGGSYLKLVTDGSIVLNRISSAGVFATSATWDTSGNLTTGGITAGGPLSVTGATTLSSTLAVTGPATLSSALAFTSVLNVTTTSASDNSISLTTDTNRVRLTTSGGANNTIGALTNGTDGRVVLLCPLAGGSGAPVIAAEDLTFPAANRIAAGSWVSPAGIATTQCYTFVYDGTTSRWFWH